MQFVLTNDDGIDAPGIRSLQRAINSLAIDSLAINSLAIDSLKMSQGSMIVAPLQHHSGCGHQVTTHRPLRLEQRSAMEYAVDGTPADCTRVALTHLCQSVSWVLSGINAGGNLGVDVYTSGTVAAVREAAFYRIPGIAISHYIHRGRSIDWDLANHLAVRVLNVLLPQPIEPGTYWNVNLPHLTAADPEPEIIFCPLCSQPLPAEYRVEGNALLYAGEYGKRSRDPGSDVAVCFGGNIAVTRISVGHSNP